MTREEAIRWTAYVQQSEPWQDRVIEALDIAIEALKAEAVQGDAIGKQFVSDAILQKISKLNAQGEKAIPIAREFIRFKRFVDGITPIRAEADRPRGEWIKATESIWKCSLCNGIMYVESNYCPFCGAKMDGERSEE